MGGLFARNARRYPDVMNAMSMPAAPAPRSVGLREVGQRAGEIYREVESSGVPVTVIDDGRPIAQIVPIQREESWYERMVRQGQVRPAKHPFRLPAERYALSEETDLDDFLFSERLEDR